MPRENRKRGKKHKKTAEEVADVVQDAAPYIEEQEAGPSWIVPAREEPTIDPNAPFGYVDAEVKAYFRTVDVQIREWQETRPEVEEDADVDPNEGTPLLACHENWCSRFLRRQTAVLRSRFDRDGGEGKTACHGPGLLNNLGTNDPLHGRLRPARFHGQAQRLVSHFSPSSHRVSH